MTSRCGGRAGVALSAVDRHRYAAFAIMTDAANEFLRKHFDERNGIRWPDGDAAKTDVAHTARH